MKYVKNEKGNALVYTLWFMLVLMAMLVIILNIGKAFAMKEQASIGADQAAFAATAEIVDKVKDGIKAFDDYDLIIDGVETDTFWQRLADGGKTVMQLIEQEKDILVGQGKYENEAYIMAMNKVLPPRINSYSLLKDKINSAYSSANLLYPTGFIVNENKGKTADTVVTKPSSSTDWRVKVEVEVIFKSIDDGKYITSFQEDIKQAGYGPKLTFIKEL